MDPRFPRRVLTPENILFCKLFAENCMKMKEFGSREAGIPGAPSDVPLSINNSFVSGFGVQPAKCLDLSMVNCITQDERPAFTVSISHSKKINLDMKMAVAH